MVVGGGEVVIGSFIKRFEYVLVFTIAEGYSGPTQNISNVALSLECKKLFSNLFTDENLDTPSIFELSNHTYLNVLGKVTVIHSNC